MRVSRWVWRVLAAGLVGSHVWLLASQWQAGRLSEPGLLLRWAAAIGMALAIQSLYRSGVHAFSRQSVVIWLLAALLHGPAVASRIGDVADLSPLPEAAITAVLQVAAAAGALSLTLLALAGFIGRRRFTAPKAWTVLSIVDTFTSLSDGFSAVVSARPPPAQL